MLCYYRLATAVVAGPLCSVDDCPSIQLLTCVIEGTTLSDEEQATLEVDALVNDDDHEPLRHALGTPLAGQFFESPRRSTPSIPPGFTVPAIPRTMAGEAAGSRPMSRTTSSSIVPAVPVVPVTPVKTETPAKAKKGKQPAKVAEPIDAIPATPTKSPSKTSIAKAQAASESSIKAVEAVTGRKRSDTKEKKTTPETPVKATTKTKVANKKADKVEKAEKVINTTEDSQQKVAIKETATSTNTANTNKRQHPGKLDIPATGKIAEKEPTPAVPQKTELAKNVRAFAPAAPSAPASPAVATGSPVKHTAAPRTLRLVSTPKTEVPPAVAAPTPTLPHLPTVDKLRSRQASIASLYQPGTPASELISDTASVTSGMISRASSPPPPGGIVGTAPVRKITKAQAKKNRQERKRQEEESMATEEKSDVEVVQAPIIGRKKKTKKPSTSKPVVAVAAKSQPASPKPATVEADPADTPIVAPVKVHSAKNSISAISEPEPHPDEARDRREPSAQAVINDLQKTGDMLVSALEFFKPLSSTLTHGSRTTASGHPTSPPDLKIHFSEADLDALAKKKPVRLSDPSGKPDSRTLITPNGKFFWGLSADLEEKALALEKQIEQLAGHARFHPTSRSAHQPFHSPSSDVLPAIATALKEAGKKLHPSSPTTTSYTQTLPPVQPHETAQPTQPPPPQPQQTPADAGAYLNQFVVPKTDNPPPNQPRPEMAAVGGAPGSGTANISVHANKFAKAAKAVIEGGAVGSTEIDGLGSMASDLLGGVFVHGLEALVSAGLGGRGDEGWEGKNVDVKGLMERFEMGVRGMQGQGQGQAQVQSGSLAGGARPRGSVLSLDEAEAAMLNARREHDVLERKLAALMKKNRKLATGGGR